MHQLDLLSYQLTPEELTDCKGAQPQPLPSSSARLWYYTQAAFYLRLIRQFMSGTKTSGAVRRHEIERLHQLRQAALVKAGEVNHV